MPDALDASPSKIGLIEHLSEQLNALALFQFGILYYLDNATSILLLRTITQVTFLVLHTPTRPQIAPIVLTSLFCLIYHVFIFSSHPDDGGYSHGGILVDFVGERGSISRWRLVSLDFLILLIQLATLAIAFEYGKLKQGKSGTTQDLEAEEEGTRRSQDGQEIELQELSPNHDQETAVGSHPSDQFYMDYTVIDLNIVRSLRSLARSTATSTSAETEDNAVSAMLNDMVARMAQRP